MKDMEWKLQFNINRMKTKRGLSTVVTSLLMILLAIVAIGIVSQILIPMIKEDLGSAGNCIDSIGNVKLNVEYTCYTGEIPNIKIEVSVITKKIQVEGFIFNVYSEGYARSEEVIENLPKENEARAYTLFAINNLNFKPETIGVSPIVGGDVCDEVDTLVIKKC